MPADLSGGAERRELDEFISLLAHDLRTPLTSIRGYAQLLLRQRRNAAPDDSLAGGLRTIMEQADRLAGLTDVLLDVSRVRLGRVALRRSEVDLAAVVRLAIAAQRAEVELDAPESGPTLNADAQRIQQAISAVLRYLRPRDGRIVARLSAPSACATLTIQSDAAPLTSEQRDQLFLRLVEQASTASGWQLAHPDLYVAHGVTQAHGGTLDVESPLDGTNHGIRFTLTLPR
jgi:signal transduction histidine kinase